MCMLPCLKWQSVKVGWLVNSSWLPFWKGLALRLLVSTILIQYLENEVWLDGGYQFRFLSTTITLIFGKIVTFFDAVKITFYGHTNTPKNWIIYFYLFKSYMWGKGALLFTPRRLWFCKLWLTKSSDANQRFQCSQHTVFIIGHQHIDEVYWQRVIMNVSSNVF